MMVLPTLPSNDDQLCGQLSSSSDGQEEQSTAGKGRRRRPRRRQKYKGQNYRHYSSSFFSKVTTNEGQLRTAEDDIACHDGHCHHFSHKSNHQVHLEEMIFKWCWRSSLSSLPSPSPLSPPSSPSHLSSGVKSSHKHLLIRSFSFLLSVAIIFCLTFASSPVIAAGLATPSSTFSEGRGSSFLAAEAEGAPPQHHKMSPSLEGFSNLNEDLMFEDSVDVQTSHYLEDGDDMATRLSSNGSSVSTQVLTENSSSRTPLRPFRLTVDHGSKSYSSMERVLETNPTSDRIRRFDSFTLSHQNFPSPPNLALIKSNLSPPLTSNHLQQPNDHAELSRFRGNEGDGDNQRRPSLTMIADLGRPRNDSENASLHGQNSITGDHILRPFTRREKRTQANQQQNSQTSFRQSVGHSKDFSIPVVDLKRISGDHIQQQHPQYNPNQIAPKQNSFFNKRLPLMSNSEEGFLLPPPARPLLPPPNSSSSLEAERRQDSGNIGSSNGSGHNKNLVRRSGGNPSSASSSSSDSFRRRFGDLAHESNFNNNNGGHGSGEHGGNSHDLSFRAFLEDDDNELSLNDLDLDDISGPPSGPHRHGHHPKNHHHGSSNHPHHHHHHHQHFKSMRKPGPHRPSNAPPHPQDSPSSSAPPSNNAPISQIMPLFFDKFLAEFGNANLPPLSPEGFSLPPNGGGKVFGGPFDGGPLPPPSSPSPVAPSPAGDLGGDLDAPRGPRGGGLKPEIGPPLINNDIGLPSPPPPSSPSADFDGPGGGGNGFSGPWPKIFRFTDGRINLHDFEREKKRSRVKFSHKLAASKALYNIKRESFLILHGGTFSQ